MFSGVFPLLTTKRVFWRGVAEELIWFIKKVPLMPNIYKFGNSSREYLDKMGFTEREEGDLGPVCMVFSGDTLERHTPPTCTQTIPVTALINP